MVGGKIFEYQDVQIVAAQNQFCLEEAELCWVFFMFYLAGINIVNTVCAAHFNRFLGLSRQFR